ncbi:MAG: hypothetical protein AAGC55_04525 [Myxococcota bacterium]
MSAARPHGSVCLAGVVLFIGTAMSACVPDDPFLCSNDMQCGQGGTCEPEGGCSFADPTCHTERRFGEYAPDGLGGQCVGASTGAVAELATGADHTCARSTAGQVWCWGRNDHGALGTGGFADSAVPKPVADLPAVQTLAAGDMHTCAVVAQDSGSGSGSASEGGDGSARDSGTVWCWGRNDRGQLGDGSTESRARPTRVAGVNDAIAVSVGAEHSCALRGDGTILCWGGNDHGQLGDGSTEGHPQAVRVDAAEAAVAVVTGAAHSCAVFNSGQLQCWGRNTFGQLGVGNREDQTAPQPLATFTEVQAVAPGRDHTCAMVASQAWCTGRNDLGQLGDDSATTRTEPVRVVGTDQVTELSAGWDFSCARSTAGQLQCWGSGADGRLGNGSSDDLARPARPVMLERAAISVHAGGRHACAQSDDGCVWCWGANDFGQLGLGTTESRDMPGAARMGCGLPL